MFYRKLIYIISILCCTIYSIAQPCVPKTFSRQISITTDNDRYLFQGEDRYYTNGTTITYSTVGRNHNSNITKQVNSFELGQKLFTPYSRRIYSPDQIDRPVAGYLYGKYKRTNFYSNNLLQLGISIGTIGNSSLGESLQDGFHQVIRVNSDYWGWIWEYQIKDEPALNLHGSYAFSLLNLEVPSFFQVTPVTKATLGTHFTNISQGLLFQLGKFNMMHQSAYWQGNLRGAPRMEFNEGPEFFLYYYPCLMFQLYNATVQGGMFRKDKGPITSSIESLLLSQQVGIMFSFHRYTAGLQVTFQSKEASTQRHKHSYGSFQLGYAFN